MKFLALNLNYRQQNRNQIKRIKNFKLNNLNIKHKFNNLMNMYKNYKSKIKN